MNLQDTEAFLGADLRGREAFLRKPGCQRIGAKVALDDEVGKPCGRQPREPREK